MARSHHPLSLQNSLFVLWSRQRKIRLFFISFRVVLFRFVGSCLFTHLMMLVRVSITLWEFTFECDDITHMTYVGMKPIETFSNCLLLAVGLDFNVYGLSCADLFRNTFDMVATVASFIEPVLKTKIYFSFDKLPSNYATTSIPIYSKFSGFFSLSIIRLLKRFYVLVSSHDHLEWFPTKIFES